jgi:hypothetical protein
MYNKLLINDLYGGFFAVNKDRIKSIYIRHNCNFNKENEDYNKIIENTEISEGYLYPSLPPPPPLPEYSVRIIFENNTNDLIPISKEEYERIKTLLTCEE